MTDYINEAQAIDIKAIVAEELAAAKASIETRIEAITQPAPPAFVDGDLVTGVSGGSQRFTGILLAKGYSFERANERTVDVEGKGRYYVLADTVTKVEKPAPAFAVGDRVLVGGKPGIIEHADEACCGDDEIKVRYDDGTSYWHGEGELESLDEREFSLVGVAECVLVGDELIVATKAGDYFSKVPVGAKVTVVGFGHPEVSNQLLKTEDADGNSINQYQSRFAWV